MHAMSVFPLQKKDGKGISARWLCPVVGHVQVVDTSSFSPPNDLPDKPFYSRYRGTFLVIRCLYLSDDLKGVEEADERAATKRVKRGLAVHIAS